MTAAIAAGVTPCPVSWCSDAGEHPWDTGWEGNSDPVRTHKCRVLDAHASHDAASRIVVEADIWEDIQEGVLRTVATIQVPGDTEIFSWAQVDELVSGLRRAAEMAFGPEVDAKPGENAHDDNH